MINSHLDLSARSVTTKVTDTNGIEVNILYPEISGPNRGKHKITLSAAQARELAHDLLRHAYEVSPRTTPKKAVGFLSLAPLAQKVVQHMRRAGSISAREAMADHGITSASLARRICDIEAAGFSVKRDRRTHPLTGQEYTRYSIEKEPC